MEPFVFKKKKKEGFFRSRCFWLEPQWGPFGNPYFSVQWKSWTHDLGSRLSTHTSCLLIKEWEMNFEKKSFWLPTSVLWRRLRVGRYRPVSGRRWALSLLLSSLWESEQTCTRGSLSHRCSPSWRQEVQGPSADLPTHWRAAAVSLKAPCGASRATSWKKLRLLIEAHDPRTLNLISWCNISDFSSDFILSSPSFSFLLRDFAFHRPDHAKVAPLPHDENKDSQWTTQSSVNASA